MSHRFAGIYTPIVTPFTADGEIDERGDRVSNVDRYLKTPLTGLVVLGSNGEAAQLEDDEADRAIAMVRDACRAGRPLLVGTGRESTRATIAASKRAASLGADAVMARTPSFYKPQMTSEAFVRHYTEVADASPGPAAALQRDDVHGRQPAAGRGREAERASRTSSALKDSGNDMLQISRLPGARRSPDSRCWRAPRRRCSTRDRSRRPRRGAGAGRYWPRSCASSCSTS